VRGDVVMAGYWRDPRATAQAIRDGWFHTGDIATIDDEGYILIVDRAKDMVLCGGENIARRKSSVCFTSIRLYSNAL